MEKVRKGKKLVHREGPAPMMETSTHSPGKEGSRLRETEKILQAQRAVWKYSQLCWLGARCKPEKIEVKRPQETVF